MFFLVGTPHSVCRSARLLTRVSSAEQTGALRSVLGGEWPGVFSVLLLNVLIAHYGGPTDMGNTCPKQAPPCPRVPCSQSPFSNIPCPATHRPLWRGLQRQLVCAGVWCCCGSSWPYAGVRQACTEFSPHTTSCLQPERERRGACVSGAAAGPLPALGSRWSQCASRACCLFVHHGEVGAPPPTPTHSLHPGKERESKVTEVAC